MLAIRKVMSAICRMKNSPFNTRLQGSHLGETAGLMLARLAVLLAKSDDAKIQCP